MKNVFFTIVLFCISGTIHSQYLVKNDVDIFINQYDTISEMMNWHHLNNDENIWQKYKSTVESLYNTIDYENLLRVDALYKNYEQRYLELLSCQIPKELDDVFKSIGWRTNGHQKFWTIHYGCTMLGIQWEINNLLKMLKEIINEEYYDEHDIEEAENTIREIKNELDPLDKSVTKLLELINIKDREIIKTNLQELMEVIDY
jgi:hypothetical protein